MKIDKNLAYKMIKDHLRMIIIVTSVTILSILFLYWLCIARYHESTDDAYLKSDITIIMPKVSGYIKEIFVLDNQAVEKNEIIARIDDRDYKAKLMQAEANLESVKITSQKLNEQYKIQEALINEAKSKLDYAASVLEMANKDYLRTKNLVKEGAVSKQAYDRNIEAKKNSSANYNSANANLLAVTHQLHVVEAELLNMKAKEKHADAEVLLSKIDLENTEIRAQNKGIISRNSLQIGQLAQPGLALAYLVHTDTIWVEANFKETQIQHMRQGQKATITIDSLHGRKLTGYVDSISPASGAEFSILPPENATGNFTKIVQRIPIKVMFNPNDYLSKLKPGMSSVVSINVK